MSAIFFDELDLPEPKYNLGIHGLAHGRMTGEMIIALEEVMLKEQPDLTMVYGDTNSTAAGAIAAVKLHIPVCHIEAGMRTSSLSNPEEVNRILTDHVSSLLFCAVESSVAVLAKENITSGVYFTGDPMYDAFMKYSRKASRYKENLTLETLSGKGEIPVPDKYYYLTCHREENTHNDESLYEIMYAMNCLEHPSVFPVHPRNRDRALSLQSKAGFNNVICVKPVGYLASIALVENAEKVVTDSGGVQREAFFAGIQCVTIFDQPTWRETFTGNMNQLAHADKNDILDKLSNKITLDPSYRPFGDGHSAKKIANLIELWYNATKKC
jgi:UDP-N-acetylglucosamine 2-epimerase (non-hydrolysing)/UDP-GlcNAc3NAcA epimerase